VRHRVRQRLGVPDERKLVLYAPTHRSDQPHRRSQRSGLDRYRFELELDLTEARKALGDDTVLMLRPHPKSVDGVPEADGAAAVDVSRWPDVRELLLAADVLVTDRSSLLIDFALTGRPMVCWGREGDNHQPGGYVEAAAIPGPVVRTAEEMLDAVVNALRAPKVDEEARRSLVRTWCPDADGQAAVRALDALLEA